MYHFFIWFLDKTLLKTYTIKYDYARHNYFIYKNKRFDVVQSFLVCRTSEKCFRLTVYNDGIIFYKSFRSARFCANFINTFVRENQTI